MYFSHPEVIQTAAQVASTHSHGMELFLANNVLLDSMGVGILVLSVGMKEWLYRQTMKIAVKTDSSVLKANAWHHRVDALSAIVALIGLSGRVSVRDGSNDVVHWAAVDGSRCRNRSGCCRAENGLRSGLGVARRNGRRRRESTESALALRRRADAGDDSCRLWEGDRLPVRGPCGGEERAGEEGGTSSALRGPARGREAAELGGSAGHEGEGGAPFTRHSQHADSGCGHLFQRSFIHVFVEICSKDHLYLCLLRYDPRSFLLTTPKWKETRQQ